MQSLPYQEGDVITIAYYRIDREQLFSWRPFRPTTSSQHSLLTFPNHVEIVPLSFGDGTLTHSIPNEYQSGEVVVEVRYVGKDRQFIQSVTSPSQQLDVQGKPIISRIVELY